MDVIELIKKEGLRRVRSGRKIYNCNVFLYHYHGKRSRLSIALLIKKDGKV
ncbi:MAG: hypothetical protein KKA65_03675 [Nanoarchaeota archaeon]|nr:hypothetical protein [Nanoarchaeota archaeon]